MFASEDMFGGDAVEGSEPAMAPPEPEEEWSASDSDDEAERKKGTPLKVDVGPPKPKTPDQEWDTDDDERSNDSPIVPQCTINSLRAPALGGPGPEYMPTPTMGGEFYGDFDPVGGVGVSPGGTGAGQGQSAAAMRKAQLDQMREKEQRKRAERLGGPGVAVASAGGAHSNTTDFRAGNQSLETEKAHKEVTETERRLQAEGISTVFDPTANCPEPATLAPAIVSPVDLSDRRTFVNRPAPRSSGVVQCQIVREKSSIFNMYPEYRLYLKGDPRNGSKASGGLGAFLLAARRRKKSKTSNYVISLDEEDKSRHSNTYCGKVRSNFIGTEFTIFDKGMSHSEAEKAGETVGPHSLRQELGFCTYESNILGAKGPRKMHVLLPKVHEDDSREEIRPANEEEDGLRKTQEEPSTRHKTMLLHNKPPKWNDKVAAFVLNFNGRVTLASVKNFQLVLEEDEEDVVLQFGKVGKDEFTMDYRWPMSPLQAFGICLGSLDNKLACE